MLKDATRNPARFVAHLLPEMHDFCVCRVRVACALTILETFDNLRTAKSYMNRLAAHDRGSYIVFSKTSKQVVAKVTRTADA